MTDANTAAVNAKPDPTFNPEPSYNLYLSPDSRQARIDFNSSNGQANIGITNIPLPPGDAEADLKHAARHGAKKALKALLDQLKDD